MSVCIKLCYFTIKFTLSSIMFLYTCLFNISLAIIYVKLAFEVCIWVRRNTTNGLRVTSLTYKAVVQGVRFPKLQATPYFSIGQYCFNLMLSGPIAGEECCPEKYSSLKVSYSPQDTSVSMHIIYNRIATPRL